MDWIAGTFELLGSWFIGNKHSFGFIFNVLGCIIWIYVAIHQEVYGLLIVVVPAILINIRNFIKWNKKQGENEMDNMLYDKAKDWLREHEDIKGASIIVKTKEGIGSVSIEHKNKVVWSYSTVE